MTFTYGGIVESWQPNMLVQDDQDVAYEPTDKEGKKLAAKLTMYLRLLMWRVKMDKTQPPPRWAYDPSYTPNCRCVLRPIVPPQD